MFARDFWRSSRWHVLEPGDPGSNFYITSGPEVIETTSTTMKLQWFLSANGTGYVDYATSQADVGTVNGQTSVAQDDFSYDYHIHTVTGLSEATTYWFRVRSTNVDGDTVTSQIYSFMTSGTQPPPTPPSALGPRYDFYGYPAPRDFPAFPTGTNVKVAPTSLAQNGDAVAFSNWVNQQPNGSIIVLDSSGGGTAYGNGTLYTFDKRVRFDTRVQGGGQRVERTITLWGYNVRMKFNNSNTNGPTAALGYNDWLPGLLNFKWGGWKDCQILGLEIYGANSGGGTPDCRNPSKGFTEGEHGLYFWAHQGTLVQDCWIHHVGGGPIYSTGNNPYLSEMFIFPYTEWRNADMTILNNRLEKTGTQNINVKIMQGFEVGYNIISRTGIHPLNFELGAQPDYPYDYRDHTNYHIHHNLIEYPANFLTASDLGWRSACVSESLASSLQPVPQHSMINWTIENNEFGGGYGSRGNPEVEYQILGYIISPENVLRHFVSVPAHFNPVDEHPAIMENLIVRSNVTRYPVNQLTKGMGMCFFFWNGVTIEDNDFQNTPITYATSGTRASTNISISNNNAVNILYTGDMTKYNNVNPTPP